MKNITKDLSQYMLDNLTSGQVPPRKERGDAPIDIAKDITVHVRGEKLHKIIWKGKQWAVTEYGIERLDGTYAISKKEVNEVAISKSNTCWPVHITNKVWVDADDFTTAWLVSIAVHGKHGESIIDQIRRSHPGHSGTGVDQDGI